VEEERARSEDEADETQERAGPVDAKALEHLHREERETSCDGGPHGGVGGKGGGGIPGEDISLVFKEKMRR
jgi:hypothetical protein